jgi:hypothetical protein
MIRFPEVLARARKTVPGAFLLVAPEGGRGGKGPRSAPACSLEQLGLQKYDESAATMISILTYGTGVPFYRLEGLQANLGIPLPSSTQWDIVERAA